MKKIFFALIFIFSSFSSYSQINDQLQGMWKGEKSSYYVIVLNDKYDNLKFINVSWAEANILNENVIEQDNESVTTGLYNPANGYKVSIKYTMIDENTVQCEFGGGSSNVSIYKRVDFLQAAKSSYGFVENSKVDERLDY